MKPLVPALALSLLVAPLGAAARDSSPPIAPPAPVAAEWRFDSEGAHAVDPDAALRRFVGLLRGGGSRAEIDAAYAGALAERARRLGGFVPARASVEDPVVMSAAIAGDLDGDGRRDVVEVVSRLMPDGSIDELRARRGADGTVLWAKTFDNLGPVFPARVGASGETGLLAVTMSRLAAPAPSAYAEAMTVGLVALGGDGATAWTQEFHGGSAGSVAGGGSVAYPFPSELFDGRTGAADDIIVLTFTDASSAAYAGSVFAVVVDGIDGSLHPFFAPELSVSGFVNFAAVPDLDGDGLEDVLIVTDNGPAGDGRGRVHARRGWNATPIWTQADLPVSGFSRLVDVGDATGDGVADVVLSATYDSPADGTDVVVLLSGATGAQQWARAGTLPYGLGDLDGDGATEVGTATVVVGAVDGFDIRFAAYDGGGATRYTHVEQIRLDGELNLGLLSLNVAGDVQPDGVTDVHFAMAAGSFGGAISTAAGTIDGRTGGKLNTAAGQPLHEAVDAVGADLALVGKPTRTSAVVSAVNGRSGATLWNTSYQAAGGTVGLLQVTAGQLTADTCADVLVSAPESSDGTWYAVLGGRDGRAAWGRRLLGGADQPLPSFGYGRDANRAC